MNKSSLSINDQIRLKLLEIKMFKYEDYKKIECINVSPEIYDKMDNHVIDGFSVFGNSFLPKEKAIFVISSFNIFVISSFNSSELIENGLFEIEL